MKKREKEKKDQREKRERIKIKKRSIHERTCVNI